MFGASNPRAEGRLGMELMCEAEKLASLPSVLARSRATGLLVTDTKMDLRQRKLGMVSIYDSDQLTPALIDLAAAVARSDAGIQQSFIVAPAGREYAIMQTRMLLNLVAEESSRKIVDVASPAVHFANAKVHMK
ncbi:hypothetical protein HDU89_005909 [Geranomyces variabilis]|nr:hypothetical protein HDU89_005909 [Geranomyces variabilis]